MDVTPISAAPKKPVTERDSPATNPTPKTAVNEEVVVRGGFCKQFWKAGDYELAGDSSNQSGVSIGTDRIRVHPLFLHSNATIHEWPLGAFAELLDNSLKEVCNGSTYVNVDVILNQKDSSKMLLVEDNGGGMSPDKLRQCMSIEYLKSSFELANTYGNGFKSSTMRLGADVIVFSRCFGTNTQSIGMLSYTFLRKTEKEDIVVPMIDYKKEEGGWKKLNRSCSSSDSSLNLETILKWSPYTSEEDLLEQFNSFKDHGGTRIVIYNLWEDDEGMLELDFDTDESDIQIRGADQRIEMAKISLRSYASTLYSLRIPSGYRMILRGKEIEHHNVVDDLPLKNISISF